MVDPHALLPDLNAARVSEANRRSRFLLIARLKLEGLLSISMEWSALRPPAPRGTTARPGGYSFSGWVGTPHYPSVDHDCVRPIDSFAHCTRHAQVPGCRCRSGMYSLLSWPPCADQKNGFGNPRGQLETRGMAYGLRACALLFLRLGISFVSPPSALGVAHRQYAKSCQRPLHPVRSRCE